MEEEMKYIGGGECRPPPVTIEDMILHYLQNRPLNRQQLSILTRIPPTTLYDHLVELMMEDKVVRFTYDGHHKGRGRKKVYWKLID